MRDRLPVIPGRRRNDTATSLILGELGHEIDPAADLEGTDWLVIFVLDPGFGADQLVQCRIGMESRWLEVWCDPLAGGEDVVEGGKGPDQAHPVGWSWIVPRSGISGRKKVVTKPSAASTVPSRNARSIPVARLTRTAVRTWCATAGGRFPNAAFRPWLCPAINPWAPLAAARASVSPLPEGRCLGSSFLSVSITMVAITGTPITAPRLLKNWRAALAVPSMR